MKTTKMLFYCTMGKPYLYKDVDNKFKLQNKEDANWINKHLSNSLNGKIVAECEVETEVIRSCISLNKGIIQYATPTLYCSELLEKSCLSLLDLYNYIGDKGYALHIKNLKIFDNPKLLRAYYVYQPNGIMSMMQHIQKAPQNMMGVYKHGERYVLISIHPEWLCKILNGEKEIEVRKKVMKEMLSNE